MCGRFALHHRLTEVAEVLQSLIEPGLEVGPRYNIAPTQPVLAARLAAEGQRRLSSLRWGWTRPGTSSSLLINARAETVASKPTFRSALGWYRCLLPASGYYEWQSHGKLKQAFYIHRKDQGLMCFAGLWKPKDPSVSPLDSVVIITTSACPSLSAIHHRMPALLTPDLWATWLSPTTPIATLLTVLSSFTGDDLQVVRVSDRVNSPHHDSPACLQPLPREPRLFREEDT